MLYGLGIILLLFSVLYTGITLIRFIRLKLLEKKEVNLSLKLGYNLLAEQTVKFGLLVSVMIAVIADVLISWR